jgi:MFS family permease
MKFRDLGAKPIILLAATAQAVQYYAAFDLALTSLPPWLRAVGGAAAGAALVWSVSYVGNRIPTITSKRARWAAYAFGGAVLIGSPVAMVLAHLVPASGWTIGLLATLPELALAASAFVDRALFAETKPKKQPQSETVAKTKRGKAKEAKIPCPHCTIPFSQSGLNAHVAYCKRNPARRPKFSLLVSERAEVERG